MRSVLRTISVSTEPVVALEEVKENLRAPDGSEDTTIERLISMATEEAEVWTGRRLRTTQLQLLIDDPPTNAWGRALRGVLLPGVPLVSVDSVTWRNEAQATTPLVANTDFAVDLGGDDQPGQIWILNDWPALDTTRPGAFQVTYTCGYASPGAIPAQLRQAIILRVGDFYANRENVIVGTSANEIPNSIRSLYWQARAGGV